MPESSPMIVSAEGRETRARSPLFICTRPLRFNAASASRQKQLERERDLEVYLLLLLQSLVWQEEVKISTLLVEMEQQNPEQYHTVINKMSFYPFLIQLHQLGRITLLADWELEGYGLDDLPRVLAKVVGEHGDIHALQTFEVLATPDIIRLPNGYVMSDFIVARRDRDGMAQG